MNDYGTHKIIYSPTPRLNQRLKERDVNYGQCYEKPHAHKIQEHLNGQLGTKVLAGMYKVVPKNYQLKEV